MSATSKFVTLAIREFVTVMLLCMYVCFLDSSLGIERTVAGSQLLFGLHFTLCTELEFTI